MRAPTPHWIFFGYRVAPQDFFGIFSSRPTRRRLAHELEERGARPAEELTPETKSAPFAH
jgi:hypothetical protein